ncbi:MAG TPA: CHASE domain-containing protein [Rubrivivax sp.]|nr:CHASE domain-containing protein [Rubrivivax sp.]
MSDGQGSPGTALVVAATAAAYALVAAAALLLAGPPGYASPLFPSAGIALVAVLVYGRPALAGVLLGSFAVNWALGALRGEGGLAAVPAPLVIGCGAALQAGIGAVLVRRGVNQPLVLNAPRDILRFGLLGAAVACLISPSIATPALLASGILPRGDWISNWATWWVGDAMGVLIGAPLALTIIGRPAADWRPRRRTLALPMLLALALLVAGVVEFGKLDRQRRLAAFERDADRLLAEAQSRLNVPLHALQALHSAARVQGGLDRVSLRQAARWWLEQPIHLQAAGYSERVAVDALPAFEAAARAQGDTNYRVFDRDGSARPHTDQEVVALRHIEPLQGNAGAIGVNSLSVPAARGAILATRDSGQPAATPGFRLVQSSDDETGVVLYQALYHNEPDGMEARRAQFRGVVFVSLRTQAAMAGLAGTGGEHLRWCLVDSDPRAERRQLAGDPGCENQPTIGTKPLQLTRSLLLAGRPLELHVSAAPQAAIGPDHKAAFLLLTAGFASAALLGGLLLTVTGHSRRTELAVHAGTAELRREMGERSKAQQALADSEARLRSILDHVPLGVMFLDARGRLLDGNARLAEMVGLPAEALHGRAVTEFLQAEEAPRLRQLRRSLLTSGRDQVADRLRLLHADGRTRIGRLSVSALRSPDNQVLRLVGVLEDITEQLRLEESERALNRSETANRAKNEFLSRMSHELRTPLNAMIGFAQLLGLDREPPLAQHQREWTQEIQRAGWHLLEMINETLDLARIESGAAQLKMEPIALAPLVRTCQAMVSNPAAQRGIRIEHAIAPDATGALGDATRLKQVLINLLSNAVKYNRQGGEVTVSTRRVRIDDTEWVEIAVADSGLGMTPTQVGGLFQPYNRLGREKTGIEGTGIGLVISRRLSELMGGTLEASSQPARGSTFTLRLPAAEPAALPPSPYTDTSPAPYQQRLVHYVEDNETNIEVMRGIFVQRPQIKLETTSLGLDGLAAIRRTKPDLVLLDMQLPDINGLELLRHLKQDDLIASIPVVVVSADATASHVQQALTSGALQYVTKPLDVAHFLQTVDSILEGVETRWGL